MCDVSRTNSLIENLRISELSSNPNGPKYIVCFIKEISGPLDLTLKIGAYKIHSFITFQPLFFDTKQQNEINHFMCTSISEDLKRLFVFDDLLDMKGGYQGFALDSNDVRVSKLIKRVPIVVLIKQ